MPLRIFDSHCHIDDSSYDTDRQQVMDRAREAKVIAVMAAGITVETCRKAVAVLGRYKGIFASVGVHPHDAKSLTEDGLSELIALSHNPRVKAWGEIGLDFNRMFSPREDQENWFARQLDTAEKLNLPVILHERDSAGRLLEILKSHPVNRAGVVHCFSGTESELFKYLDLGYHIGITGVLTHKERGEELRRLAVKIPRDRILVETDAPYLTPWPRRNKVRRNEPAFVADVLERLSEVFDCGLEKLGETIFQNTLDVFGITEEEILT